jgi:2-polyprenyl-3-methyl-5-hydroxy-6-metoxy-1,4-benzoquinol methylase
MIDKDIIARVAARYTRTGTRFYVRGKLGSDPACSQVVELGQKLGGLGEVVDVGCGRGQMLILLHELGLATSGVGFDWDEEKIKEATAAATGPLSFRKGDAREHIPACDTVLLLDVLHYLTDEEQTQVVDRVASAARRAVVIRELDPDRGWRSTVTRVQEGITTFFRYNVGARVLIRPIAPVVERLEGAGFSVEVLPSWGSTPFANVAIVATR